MSAWEVSWGSFVAQAAEIAGLPVHEISRDTRVIGDLGLDSLALTELVVVLTNDYQMNGLPGRLAEADWESLTLGEMYDGFHRQPTTA